MNRSDFIGSLSPLSGSPILDNISSEVRLAVLNGAASKAVEPGMAGFV